MGACKILNLTIYLGLMDIFVRFLLILTTNKVLLCKALCSAAIQVVGADFYFKTREEAHDY